MLKTIKNSLIIICVCFFISGCTANEITYTSISIDQMDEFIDDGIIIDVRTYDEYVTYNIDDSINIPLDEIETIENIIIDKDTQIFVYCASGARSNLAAETLVELGYTNVYDMGGIYG